MIRALIIGGGLTGGVTAGLLRKERNDVEVILWERGTEIGGRMSTTPSPGKSDCTTDLGPQFVIATLEYIRDHAQFYDELLEDDMLVSCSGELEGMKWPSTSMAFVAPLGIGSLTQHFFSKADAKVCLQHQAQIVNVDKDSGKWQVTATNGNVEFADIVILAVPVPQILQLEGDIKCIIESQEEIKHSLQIISYTPRFSLGLYYHNPIQFLEDLPWVAKLYRNDDMIQFISIDNKKRENPNALPGLAIQTTIPFSWSHMNDDRSKIESMLTERVYELIPGLPTPDGSHLKYWTYAKVDHPHPDYIGCLILNHKPLLVAGGDSFTQSSFNGCLDSAMRIVEEVLRHLK